MSLMLNSNSDDGETLYSDSVFSTYLYTGNGSTQTINNGIDLAGKGGLVWIKQRNGTYNNLLTDTARGGGNQLVSNTTAAQDGYTNITFNSNGITLANNPEVNGSGNTFASWTFRKAAKFFDVVTYTGDGTSSKIINHNLNCMPGMIIVKTTASSADWVVCNRYTDTNYIGRYNIYDYALNTTGLAGAGIDPALRGITTTSFDAAKLSGTNASYEITKGNASGQTYVAYVFAHDTSATGIIQCGSFTTDASGNATVNLGWEPQYTMIKASSSGGWWEIYDTMRGMTASSIGNIWKELATNVANAEGGAGMASAGINSTGFTLSGQQMSQTYIYMAIRRPNKPPTSGTQVYMPIARTGTGAAATVTGAGFAPDLVIGECRTMANGSTFKDRLRGMGLHSYPFSTSAEGSDATAITSLNMDGMSVGTDAVTGCFNLSSQTYINHFFKRAPGFFDVVCYTGDGRATENVAHNLQTIPELVITKRRDSPQYWFVDIPNGHNKTGQLHLSDAWFQNWSPNPAEWYVATSTTVRKAIDVSGGTFVAYLFATLAGISKVGSYTGNGSTQNIECGFAAGARFVLIKRTDSAGDWYVWDTARGIVSANDPHLSLNTSVLEVTTDDSVDPYSPGFTVNQVAATNINVTSATYIFLAIA